MHLLDFVEKYLGQGNKLFMRDWAPSKDNFKLARWVDGVANYIPFFSYTQPSISQMPHVCSWRPKAFPILEICSEHAVKNSKSPFGISNMKGMVCSSKRTLVWTEMWFQCEMKWLCHDCLSRHWVTLRCIVWKMLNATKIRFHMTVIELNRMVR